MALYNNEVEDGIYADSFCELYVSRQAVDIESSKSRYAFLEKCAVAERITANTLGLEMCAHTIITVQTVRFFSPNLAADLETTKFAGVNPLYPGYFAPVKGKDGLPAAALAVHGCKWIRDEAAGASDKLPAKVKRPGGAIWSHDYMKTSGRDGLRVVPYEVGHDMHEIFDSSARLARNEEDGGTGQFKPALMEIYRPSGMFTRWRHVASSIKPSIFDDRERILNLDGDSYKLRRIPLGPWSEECENERRSKYDGLCQDPSTGAGTTLDVTVDPAPSPETSFYPSITYDWDQCTTNSFDPTVCNPNLGHCDYRTHKPVKVAMGKLTSYSPAIRLFLERFKVSTYDIEWMMGQYDYNNTFTKYSKPNKARRHASCEWVRANSHRWLEYLPGSWNSSRCLGEINGRFEGLKYMPGIMCSGHGKCISGPETFAGVCSCDLGYVGSFCDTLGTGVIIHPSINDTPTLVAFSLSMAFLLVFVFFFTVIGTNRHEPLLFYCSALYCFNVTFAGATSFALIPLLLQPIGTLACLLRPFVGIFSFHLFVGTIFARVYRTTVVMWGKGPPDKIICDPLYLSRILKKTLYPYIPIGLIWITSSLFQDGPIARPTRVDGRVWEEYYVCSYGQLGDTFLTVATVYAYSIGIWGAGLLYYMHKRTLLTKNDVYYFGERRQLSKSVGWFLVSSTVTYFSLNLHSVPSAAAPNAISVQWVLALILIPATTVPAVWMIMFPKYKGIYVHKDQNQVQKGVRYGIEITEGGVKRRVVPTIDEHDIDPRLLRENKELLKENLEYLAQKQAKEAEMERLEIVVSQYEVSRDIATPNVQERNKGLLGDEESVSSYSSSSSGSGSGPGEGDAASNASSVGNDSPRSTHSEVVVVEKIVPDTEQNDGVAVEVGPEEEAGAGTDPRPEAADHTEGAHEAEDTFEEYEQIVRATENKKDIVRSDTPLDVRLEKLLSHTETQAGALLRELDKINVSQVQQDKALRHKKAKINNLTSTIRNMRKGRVRYQTVAYHSLPQLPEILSSLRLLNYERTFAKKKMTTAKLIGLTDEELQALGMKRGHRRRLQVYLQSIIGDKPPMLPTPEPSVVSAEERVSDADSEGANFKYQESSSSDSSVHEEDSEDDEDEDEDEGEDEDSDGADVLDNGTAGDIASEGVGTDVSKGEVSTKLEDKGSQEKTANLDDK